jgi:hypothetical protein
MVYSTVGPSHLELDTVDFERTCQFQSPAAYNAHNRDQTRKIHTFKPAATHRILLPCLRPMYYAFDVSIPIKKTAQKCNQDTRLLPFHGLGTSAVYARKEQTEVAHRIGALQPIYGLWQASKVKIEDPQDSMEYIQRTPAKRDMHGGRTGKCTRKAVPNMLEK